MPTYRLTPVIYLVLIILLATAACGSKSLSIMPNNSLQLSSPADSSLLVIHQTKEDNSADCHSHYKLLKSACDAEAQRILASTLRIKFDEGYIFHDKIGYINLAGNGHGTVMDGRYFLTHWHYDAAQRNMFPSGTFDETAKFRLYRADGTLLIELKQAPLKIKNVYGETLVLDFGLHNGNGFFDELDIPSASFSVDVEEKVRPNDTVARVNWNKQTAFIEWTKVRHVTAYEDTPSIAMDNLLTPGSSGGGVYLEGRHIANIWMNMGNTDSETGKITSGFAVAALNISPEIEPALHTPANRIIEGRAQQTELNWQAAQLETISPSTNQHFGDAQARQNTPTAQNP